MARSRKNFWSSFLRLTAYYVIVGALVLGLVAVFPMLEGSF